MQRKIVKLGPSTLTISLPSKWVKEQHLAPGNDLTIEEHNNQLLISTGTPETTTEKITLDISTHPALIKRLYAATYLQGADEIEIITANHEQSRILQQRTQELIGMEIIKQEKNKLTIKDLSNNTHENFDNITNRILYLLHSMSDEILKAITNKEQELNYIEDMEKNINKFTDYCLRLLNKNLYPEKRKTPAIYCIIYLLEELGDHYKRLVYQLKNTTLDNKLINLYEKINTYHKNYEKLHLKYSKEKAITLAQERDQLIQKIREEQEKRKNPKDIIILNHYENIIET
ncbi:MAG: phosphate uptake regulator PhoU, partial [Nanoarchaeota archaeon]|nr:phosphate uptake regulator PhoU [Nanoarchaeota archaeon]